MPGKVCFPQGEPVAAAASHIGLAEHRGVPLRCAARTLLTPLLQTNRTGLSELRKTP